MKLSLLALSAVLAAALAQDTYHCPDGWDLHEHRDTCDCFLMSGSERVTKSDADSCVSSMTGPGSPRPIIQDLTTGSSQSSWRKPRLESTLCSGWAPMPSAATTRTRPGSGSGSTATRPWAGLTGLRASPTTTTTAGRCVSA